MKGLLLGLLLAAGGPALNAAETSAAPAKVAKKAKSRTLKQIIDLALREGAEGKIAPDFSQLLFGRPDAPAKRLRYKAAICPDERDHSLRVVVEQSADEPPTPKALYLTVFKSEDRDGVRFMKGYDFVATLDGRLQKAYLSDGKRDDLEPVEQDISSPTLVKEFEAEKRFHLETVPRLGLRFAQ